MNARWPVTFFRKLQTAWLVLLSLSLTAGIYAAPLLPTLITVKKWQFQEVNATTRLVIDLNALPKDMAIEDQPGKPMSIRFKATTATQAGPANQRFTWPNLSGVYMDSGNDKLQIFIKRNMTGTVTVETVGTRLIVNIPHFYYRVNANQEISEGVRYVRFTEHTAQGPVQVNILEIDPKNPAVDITPALAQNRMGGKANVSALVAGHQAVAGINGSFFKPDVGTPLGILMINQELISGPLYDRVALGITPNNELVMSRIRLGGEIVLPNRQSIPVQNINQPRVKASATVVYSPRWGNMAPKMPDNGIQIQLRNNRVSAVSTEEPLPIPADGMVISGQNSPLMSALASLGANDPVQLNVYTLPDWSGMKHAVGGGPWLLRDGKPYVDLQAQHFNSKSLGFREPRSAVGITRDGKMLLVTVDGRQKNVSVGMTLYELAYLMRKLNAVDAMNLDGGSSTQMSLYGKTVNQPSAGNVGVSNALLIRKASGTPVATSPF